jgi:hypothetical protein
MSNFIMIGFPYTFLFLYLGILVGSIATFFFFGFVSFCILVFCIWTDVLSIDPFLRFLQNSIESLFPNRYSQLQESIRQTFQVQIPATTVTAIEETGPRRIFVWHPHGAITSSMIFHTLTPSTAFPASIRPNHLVYIDWFSKAPFFNQLVKRCNLLSSNYEDIKGAIQRDESISISLGGIRETMETSPGVLRLSIGTKRGIFRLALEEGCSLIPCISYGENECFICVKGVWLSKLKEWLLGLRIALQLPTWETMKKWWGLQHAPFADPITTVVGEPLVVAKKDKDLICERDIVALREDYITRLRALYAATRPASYAEELEII